MLISGTWTTAPNRDDNEINPDVLGYIFEKYINQKQMGAYYTKEDITGYITRNTVIPIPVRRRQEENVPSRSCPKGAYGVCCKTIPDRYIYPACRAWRSLGRTLPDVRSRAIAG